MSDQPSISVRVAQEQRIRELEAQIVEARNLLNPVCEDETLCGAIRNLQQAHVTERDNAIKAEVRLRDLDWTPISESNLPKVGDETLREWNGRPSAETVTPLRAQMNRCAGDWHEDGWTHRRPINAPDRTAK